MGRTKGAADLYFNNSRDDLFDASSTRFATAGGRTAKIWSITGQLVASLDHAANVEWIALGPDERTAITAMNDRTVTVWDIATRRPRFTDTARAVIRDLAVEFGGTLFAVASDSGVEIWDLAGVVRSLDVGAVAIAFDPLGERLVTAGDGDHPMAVWSTSGRRLGTFSSGHAGTITGVAETRDGQLVTAGRDGTIRLWADGRQVAVLGAGADPIADLAFSPDGRTLAAAGAHRPYVWDLKTSGTLRAFEAQPSRSARVVVDSDRQLAMLELSPQTAVVRYDIATGRPLPPLHHNCKALPALVPLPDGGLLVACAAELAHEYFVRPRDLVTNRWLPMLGTLRHEFRGIAFSRDGERAATYSADGFGEYETVHLWNVRTGELLLRLLDHASVSAIAMADNASWFATGDSDGRIVVWDPVSGAARDLLGHHGGITALATGAPTNLASGGMDHEIRIWDPRTGVTRRTLVGHTSPVEALALHPSGLLASSGPDRRLNLWDSRTGELLATLVSFSDGREWIASTPQGMFDGSPGAFNRVLWRFSQRLADVTPVETFFNEFFHPGLVAELVAGQRPAPRRALTRVDRRAPVVHIAAPNSSTTRRVEVRIDVAETPSDAWHSAASGAQDVRLFRNGALVERWRGDVLRGRSSATLTARVDVIAGENRFNAYAFSREDIKSADAQAIVRGARVLRRDPATHVVIVGVDHYADPLFDLAYAASDARALAAALDRQQRAMGRAPILLRELLDREATKANILSALGGVPAEPEDTVVVFFAGHGFADGEHYFFLPHDLGYAGPITFDAAARQALREHAISDRELEQTFAGLDAAHLILVIDACESGKALEATEWRRGPMNAHGLAQLAYEKGMYVLVASQSYQAALEATELGHGLLTYALVDEGLSRLQADANSDGAVTVREWLDYAVRRVPELQRGVLQSLAGRGLAFVPGEEAVADPGRRTLQQPRAFYRREIEDDTLVVAIAAP